MRSNEIKYECAYHEKRRESHVGIQGSRGSDPARFAGVGYGMAARTRWRALTAVTTE